ncbi:disulfide bond formation protein B [Brevibacillus laterosporus]|uniref:disulfide oxidoreductase n=1 Tax=Brevibacillus laterosporus TaxID=1465 RepID=UPI000BD4EE19|nr:disulfide oxidoreductase [Brevibacillus laterosporus]PCN44328.1 disulfide bond formation protein B [Brevibacillus laterosporus]
MNKPLVFSWITAIIATVGSLYFSEVMHFVPCTLCWYQRILMYPLTILLGMAVYHNDTSIYRYILPLSIIGMITSAYHYSVQKVPFMKGMSFCTQGVPCTGEYINWLGFITIPFLALVAFVMITICLLVVKRGADTE